MSRIIKICCIAGGLIIVALSILIWRAVVFVESLSDSKLQTIADLVGPHFGYLGLVFILLLSGGILACVLLLNLYVFPVRRLIEETNLIHSANPEHRISSSVGPHCRNLAESINNLADQHSALLKNIDNEISLSKAEVEREKNILAAFIGELDEGVLICNAEGGIMFYNKRAKDLFAPKEESQAGGEGATDKGEYDHKAKQAHVGLGRSIFNIIDKNLIVHALDEVASKLHRTDKYITSHFIVATRASKLLRVETVPVLNKKLELSGFVFSASDITERLQRDSRLDALMQTLVKKIRASVGGIRSSVETILTYPEMEKEQLSRFNTIIHSESILLGEVVDEVMSVYPEHITTRWPLIPMETAELVEKVRQKAGNTLGVSLYIERSDRDTWVKVENYSAVLVILFVLNQLKEETEKLDFFCKVGKAENFINIDLSWKGEPIPIKTIRNWDKKPLKIRNNGLELTLQEVLDHHGGNLWLHSNGEQSERSVLRIILPSCEHREPETKRSITILAEETRPVFYDFELFKQQSVGSEFDSRQLSELEYTVFDTETTGLSPRGGDEIISLGGVRVVNGQILQEEKFETMVDPCRDIPLPSIRIHGIQPEMVNGQPRIGEVLPEFYSFSEDTVLIAHNAAFDMLMLKMKEKSTGVSFTNPVLDTLLLWDVLHPSQENNSFSSIAEMLGVRIIGRHTALGDALTTAEVFCKMIPLLAQKNILTLSDALEASRQSRYARLEY